MSVTSGKLLKIIDELPGKTADIKQCEYFASEDNLDNNRIIPQNKQGRHTGNCRSPCIECLTSL